MAKCPKVRYVSAEGFELIIEMKGWHDKDGLPERSLIPPPTIQLTESLDGPGATFVYRGDV